MAKPNRFALAKLLGGQIICSKKEITAESSNYRPPGIRSDRRILQTARRLRYVYAVIGAVCYFIFTTPPRHNVTTRETTTPTALKTLPARNETISSNIVAVVASVASVALLRVRERSVSPTRYATKSPRHYSYASKHGDDDGDDDNNDDLAIAQQ